jgi:nonsense-mediated mRNA decay protein 3
MCDTCERSRIDISDGITKQGLLHYCKLCDRYQRPPWVRCDLESANMMSMCLSKIKGLNKVKLVDSSFVWTEPHSKIVKLKLTIQKEFNKSMIQTSFIVVFDVEWTQCDDCKKTFTPHTWNASCQVRQKVNHKRTFMLLEQYILKHKAHAKALNIKEMTEGIDFFFSNKSHACAFSEFIHSVLPAKIKQSKTLVSHDQRSNLFNYKYTYMIEIAPVCKDDLIFLEKDISKELGGIGPVLLCSKICTNVHLIDPLTLKSYEFDENTYWKYNFKSFVDRNSLEEFLILNIEEDIDYSQYKFRQPTDVVMSDVSNSKISNTIHSKSTNYKLTGKKDQEKKVIIMTCVYANKASDGTVFTVKTHLEKLRPGDIAFGIYFLT